MKRSKKGFTIIEIMVCVAIVVTLLSLGAGNVVEMKKKTSQAQLDHEAEILYTAFAAQAVRDYTSGNGDKYHTQDIEPIGSIKKFPVNYLPSTYEEPDDWDEGHMGYYVKGSLDTLFTADVTDTQLYNKYWVVELNYASCSIHAIWISDEPINYDPETFNALRLSKNRTEAKIGYYGGGTVPYSEWRREYSGSTEINKETNEQVIETGFVYYEIYEDDGNLLTPDWGYYEFSNKLDRLQDRLVIGDGYGFVIGEQDKTCSITVKERTTFDITYNGGLNCELVYLGNSGVLVRLPNTWHNPNFIGNSNLNKSTPTANKEYNKPFYNTIVATYTGVKGMTTEAYCYSPFYAKCAVALQNDLYTLPKEVYIRSARQLYAMGFYYCAYYNEFRANGWHEPRVANTTFIQQLDLDYAKYDFETYAKEKSLGQLPIGVEWGRFISVYDGCGHEIRNMKLIPRNRKSLEYTFSGLFGLTVDCTIKNVNITADSNIDVVSADYTGILAAHVQNSTITNCTVNNYTIEYKQTMSYQQTIGGNEFANARVGCLIGYVKAPNEDNSQYYTTISNCKVTNCVIKASDYLKTVQYNRQYQLGCFIGAVANFESNQSRASHITISDCSVQCAIQTKSYGQGSNYCYIGSFSGAIKKYVKLVNITYVKVTDTNSKKHTSGYATT